MNTRKSFINTNFFLLILRNEFLISINVGYLKIFKKTTITNIRNDFLVFVIIF